MTPRTALIAITAVTAAFMAGCTSPAPEPAPTPTTSTTSSSSTSTTTSTAPATSTSSTAGPSAVPDAAQGQSADGAVEFTRFFADLSNRAYSKVDPSLISGYVLPSCQSCAAMINSLTDWKNKGQKYVGTFVNPTKITSVAFPGDGSARVLLTTNTTGSKVVDASENIVTTYPPESGDLIYSLSYQSGGWKVATIKAAG